MFRLLSSGGFVGTAGGRVDSLMMILLHWARVPARLPANVTAAWLARLPRQRSAVLARELAAGRGLESLTGLALLVRSSQYLSLPPISLLAGNAGGKPRWADGPDFSIAHAAGFAVCAVAAPGVAIGVDLESADAVNPQSLRLVTSASERAQIGAGGRSATALWTCKEAVLKAAGTGVAAAREVEINDAVGHHAGREYHLMRIDLDRNLVLTIATSVPVPGSRVVYVSATALFDVAPVGGRRSNA
jgi:phosphopantetheinyl transferase